MKPEEYNQLTIFERALLEEFRKLRDVIDDLRREISSI